MQIYLPTNVYSETDCVMNHRKELAALGSRALLVTGKHSSRINGALEDVQKALQEERTSYVVFDEIEENPSIETVIKARTLGVQEQVDFVVGIGGGKSHCPNDRTSNRNPGAALSKTGAACASIG